MWEDILKLNNILIKLVKGFFKSFSKSRIFIIIVIVIAIEIIFFINLVF